MDGKMFTQGRRVGTYKTDIDDVINTAKNTKPVSESGSGSNGTNTGRTRIPNHKSIVYDDGPVLKQPPKRIFNEKKKQPENDIPLNQDDEPKVDSKNTDVNSSLGDVSDLGGGEQDQQTDTGEPNSSAEQDDSDMDLSGEDDGDFGSSSDDPHMGTDGEPNTDAMGEEDEEEAKQEKFTKYHYFTLFEELSNNIEQFNVKFATYETSPDLGDATKREMYLYIKTRIAKIKNDISFILQYRIRNLDLDLLKKAYNNQKQQLIILFELFFNLFKDAKTKTVASQFRKIKSNKKASSKS